MNTPAGSCPTVEAVATVLADGPKILAVFNPRWGGFTLPMSKRKQFRDSSVSAVTRTEEWACAAARVAAVVLGRSFMMDEFPRPLCEIKDFEQSDADGVWKLYTIQVFGQAVAGDVRLAPGVVAEWLRPEDFQQREPMTRTVRFVLGRWRSEACCRRGESEAAATRPCTGHPYSCSRKWWQGRVGQASRRSPPSFPGRTRRWIIPGIKIP